MNHPIRLTFNRDKTNYLNTLACANTTDTQRQYYARQQCETALRTESGEKQLLYLHAITSMQTNCLVCMAELTEVRQSSHEAKPLLDAWRRLARVGHQRRQRFISVKLRITSARPLWTTQCWSNIQIIVFNRIVLKKCGMPLVTKYQLEAFFVAEQEDWC